MGDHHARAAHRANNFSQSDDESDAIALVGGASLSPFAVWTPAALTRKMESLRRLVALGTDTFDVGSGRDGTRRRAHARRAVNAWTRIYMDDGVSDGHVRHHFTAKHAPLRPDGMFGRMLSEMFAGVTRSLRFHRAAR